MKSDVICPVCKTHLGRKHGYEEAGTVKEHIYHVHPTEYNEISAAYALSQRIWKKYRVHTRELFYYRPIPGMFDGKKIEVITVEDE